MELLFQGLAGALLPVWLPIVAAPLIYLLRRQSLVASLLASAVMGVTGWWLQARPPAGDLTLFGRPLLLGPLGQALLIALALWLLYMFLYSWRISQGWSVFPFLLIVYGLIAAALFFDELILQVLLLKVAWLVVILLVQGGAAANTRAATRLLILTVLALPPFLLAGSLLGRMVFQPDQAPPEGLIVLALGMGFALMLAIIPFHAWLPQVTEDGPPLIAAWLVAGLGSSYLVLLLDLLTRYSWLAADEQAQRLLLGGGLLMALLGGALALTERHLGRLWAYAVLADLGYVLLALSFNEPLGRLAALLLLGSRLISLLLAGSALATIRHRATSLRFDDLVGVGARLPLSMLAFLVGGAAMWGMPLTSGFPGHWAVLRLLAEDGSRWLWLLVAASVVGMVGFLRALAVMVAPVESSVIAQVEQEPRVATSFLVALGSLAVLLGIAPHLLDPILAYILGQSLF